MVSFERGEMREAELYIERERRWLFTRQKKIIFFPSLILDTFKSRLYFINSTASRDYYTHMKKKTTIFEVLGCNFEDYQKKGPIFLDRLIAVISYTPHCLSSTIKIYTNCIK
jgi:hypothetical protein